MITIKTDMTDSNLFENYWMPLISKYREVNFLFGNTKDLKYPRKFNWSNVKFAPKASRKILKKYAETKVVYMTYQNEIPTYQIMTELIKGKSGVGTTNGNSYSTDKEKESEIKERYKTYLI